MGGSEPRAKPRPAAKRTRNMAREAKAKRRRANVRPKVQKSPKVGFKIKGTHQAEGMAYKVLA
jgi:hypothetical protein